MISIRCGPAVVEKDLRSIVILLGRRCFDRHSIFVKLTCSREFLRCAAGMAAFDTY